MIMKDSNTQESFGKNKNNGFSLIELIVVIAIMAVLVVILAPALLTYNERSRAEKDNKTMDEVVNAIQLALADQEIYDEVLAYSTTDNISCYVDTENESNYQKITTKSNPSGVDQYTFDSTSRQLDETPFYAAGNMRGVTITFAPDKGSNGSTFDLKQGVINQYIQIKGNQRFGALPKLYSRIKSSIGETVINNSQTYRNSEFTVFIALGTTGGNDTTAQDAIRLYGQWSGTNLPTEVSYKIVSDRTTGDDGNTIIEIDDSKWNTENGNKITVNPGDLNGGGSFTPSTSTGNSNEDFIEDEIAETLIDGTTLKAGVPYGGELLALGASDSAVFFFDTHLSFYGDPADISGGRATMYHLTYDVVNGTIVLDESSGDLAGMTLVPSEDGNSVEAPMIGVTLALNNSDVIYDKTYVYCYSGSDYNESYYPKVLNPYLESYPSYKRSVNGKPVNCLYETYANCINMKNTVIEDHIQIIDEMAFENCDSLVEITVPSTVTGIGLNAFADCNKLKNVTICSELDQISGEIFVNCPSLETITFNSTIPRLVPNEIVDVASCPNVKNIFVPTEHVFEYKKQINKNANIITPIDGSVATLAGTTWEFNSYLFDFNWMPRFDYESQVIPNRFPNGCTMTDGEFLLDVWSLTPGDGFGITILGPVHPSDADYAFWYIPRNSIGLPDGWYKVDRETIYKINNNLIDSVDEIVYKIKPMEPPTISFSEQSNSVLENERMIEWFIANAKQQ